MSSKQKNNISELKQILKYVKPYKWHLFAAIIALILSSSAVLGLGQGIKFLVDKGLQSNNSNMLDKSILFLLGIIILLAISTFARFYFITGVGEKIISDIRKDLYRNLISLSPSFYEQTRIGDIMSRMTTDTTILQLVIGSSLSVAARNIILFFGGIIMMFSESPKLTMITIITILTITIPQIILFKRLKKLSQISQDKIADMSALLEESLNGIRTLQSYNRENIERNLFGDKVDIALRAAMERIKLRAIITAIVIIFAFGSIALILWQGGKDVMAGNLTGGDLSSFIFYSVIVASSFGAISQVIGDLHRASGAVVELMGFINKQSDIKEIENPSILPDKIDARIEFKDVSFHYPTKQEIAALKNISFSIEPDEIVAIVGASGAGKSTLLQLLIRFYDCDEGEVSIDGINVKNLKLEELRNLFAYVSQEIMIFSSTAKENIRYAIPSATDKEVEEAARKACAYDFISTLPDTFDTYLGEKGVKLSGGEKQRIAIARAILKNPRILLLDEATSALDSENERLVQNGLETLMKGRTTIVIAHRLTTIVNADKIIVMDNGNIDSIGTHTELIKNSDKYKKLYDMQFNNIA